MADNQPNTGGGPPFNMEESARWMANMQQMFRMMTQSAGMTFPMSSPMPPASSPVPSARSGSSRSEPPPKKRKHGLGPINGNRGTSRSLQAQQLFLSDGSGPSTSAAPIGGGESSSGDQTFSKTFVLLTKRGATIPDAVTLLELSEKGCGEKSVTFSPRDTKKEVLRKLKQEFPVLDDEQQAIQWMKGEGGRSSALEGIKVNDSPVFWLTGSQIKKLTCGKIYLVPLQKDIRLRLDFDEYLMCQWCYSTFTAEEIVEHIESCPRNPANLSADEEIFIPLSIPLSSPDRGVFESPPIVDFFEAVPSTPQSEEVPPVGSVSHASSSDQPIFSCEAVDAQTIISMLQAPTPLKRNEEKAFSNFKQFVKNAEAGQLVNGLNGNTVNTCAIFKWITGINAPITGMTAPIINVSFLPDSVDPVYPTVTPNSLSLPTITDYSELSELLLCAITSYDCDE